MSFKIGAFAFGIGGVLAAGAVLLAVTDNPVWPTFLGTAALLAIISAAVKLLS